MWKNQELRRIWMDLVWTKATSSKKAENLEGLEFAWNTTLKSKTNKTRRLAFSQFLPEQEVLEVSIASLCNLCSLNDFL